jgi:PadR family transcriptional regulator PadR
MPRRACPRHGEGHPCSCAMGNLYRFVEPVLLLLLKEKGRSYGYQLAAELPKHALTDSSIEAAALYKTLRQLEENDCVTSEWDVNGNGPARRVYSLTVRGEEHLVEWITVLGHMAKSMTRFVGAAEKCAKAPAAAVTGLAVPRGLKLRVQRKRGIA